MFALKRAFDAPIFPGDDPNSALFADDLGENQPGRLSGTLGLRYGHF